jgi:hypothetical protein
MRAASTQTLDQGLRKGFMAWIFKRRHL